MLRHWNSFALLQLHFSNRLIISVDLYVLYLSKNIVEEIPLQTASFPSQNGCWQVPDLWYLCGYVLVRSCLVRVTHWLRFGVLGDLHLSQGSTPPICVYSLGHWVILNLSVLHLENILLCFFTKGPSPSPRSCQMPGAGTAPGASLPLCFLAGAVGWAPSAAMGVPLTAPGPQGAPDPCCAIFGMEIIFDKKCVKMYCYYLPLTFTLHRWK